MDAVRSFAPQLDRARLHAKRTPVFRAGRGGLLSLGEMREPGTQRGEILDRLALAGERGLELVQQVTLVKSRVVV